MDRALDYTFIRSKRKTIGITVKPDGSIVLRAPLRCSKRQAEEFLFEKREWILATQKKIIEKRMAVREASFTEEELSEIKKRARKIISPMVAAISREMGVDYVRLSIRAQRTRWGSCSAKGNLNFNCLLVLLPENVQRYVVVHELCHRKEMNHSKRFWAEVAKFQPTYVSDRKQLKTEGSRLIERLP